MTMPSQETVRALPYWEAQDFLSEDDSPDYSHERSRYVRQPMPPDGARTILDFLRRWPGTHADVNWKMFLAGEAVAAVPPAATAFVHRDALMISSIELDWTADDTVGTVADNEAWLADFHAAMAPFTSDECYQNFIDEAQNDYLRAYYGANLERLVAVKRRYDPRNVFTYPQGIPLTL
jgi:FAD/FMN-containing dehydrogenase